MAFLKNSLVTQYSLTVVGLIGVYILTRHLYNYASDLTMTTYRDKSALYGRELKPGEVEVARWSGWRPLDGQGGGR